MHTVFKTKAKAKTIETKSKIIAHTYVINVWDIYGNLTFICISPVQYLKIIHKWGCGEYLPHRFAA